MMQEKENFKEVKVNMPLAMFMTGVLSIVTTLTTFRGLLLYTDTNSPLMLVIITMVSITVGLGAFTVWHYIYKYIPAAIVNRNWVSVTVNVLGLFLFMGVIAFISMYSNAIGIYGEKAVIMHHKKNTAQAIDKINKVFSKAYNFESMIDQMRGKADSFESLKQGELNHGDISGNKGKGVVAAAFSTSSVKLAQYSNTLKAKAKQLPDYHQDAKKIIKELSKVYEGGVVTSDRQARVTVLNLELEDVLSKVASIISSKNIASLAKESKNWFQFTQSKSRSKAFREKQKLILAGQQSQLNQMMDGMITLAKDYEAEAPKKGTLFQEISISDATVKYYRDFIPGVAMAVGLDLFPLIILIVLIGIALYRYRLSPYHDLTVREASHIHGIWQEQIDAAAKNTKQEN